MAIDHWPRGYRAGSLASIPIASVAIGLALLPALGLHTMIGVALLASKSAWGLIAFSLLIGLEVVLSALTLLLICITIRKILNLGNLNSPIDNFGKDFNIFTAYHAVNLLVWHTVLPFIVNTWLIVLFFRAMGAKIGKGCFINTPNLFECPMITIGDGVIIGAYAVLNPHSSEDHRIVFGKIEIGDGAEIGAGTIILPDVKIEPGVMVAANSLVPKGKVLKAGCCYAGVPVRLVPRSAGKAIADTEQPLARDTPHDETSGRPPLTNDQIKVVLIEAYKIQSSEAADLGRFMVRLSLAVLGISFSGIYYSITNNISTALGGIAPLVGFTLAMLTNLSTMMLKNAYKMCEIELYLKKYAAIGLDWELRFGGLGRNRMLDADNILVTIIFIFLFIFGTWLTWSGSLIDVDVMINAWPVYRVVGYIDVFVGSWMIFSILYYVSRRARFMRLLQLMGPREIIPLEKVHAI